MEATSGLRSPIRGAASSELSARRAVQAAYLGFFVDMFDVYLPIAVLAPALNYFIPAGLSGAQATIWRRAFEPGSVRADTASATVWRPSCPAFNPFTCWASPS